VALLTKTGTAEICYFDALKNSLTVLAAASAGTSSATLKFVVNGSSLALYLNGSSTALVSITDTTLSSAGGVGIFAQGAGGILDNFSVTGL
jgi:hypothetical protein